MKHYDFAKAHIGVIPHIGRDFCVLITIFPKPTIKFFHQQVFIIIKIRHRKSTTDSLKITILNYFRPLCSLLYSRDANTGHTT